MKKKLFYYIAPVVSVLAGSLLYFTNIDLKIADAFQRPLKSTAQNPGIVMINVDDQSLKKIGTFPLDRDVYTDSLYVLKDLGVKEVVSDLSFFGNSKLKVDETYVNHGLPFSISEEFNSFDGSFQSMEYIKQNIINSIPDVIKPVDQQLADSIGFFENTVLCFSFDDSAKPTEEEKNAIHLARMKNVVAMEDNVTPEFSGLHCTLPILLEKSMTAGFVNAERDGDGYLRRLEPVIKFNGEYFAQLALASMIHFFGDPVVYISSERIVLKDALYPDGSIQDIVIPRAQDGTILLKYPKVKYDDYNAISLWNIYRLSILEENLKILLKDMNGFGFFGYVQDNPCNWLDACAYLKEELLGGENPDFGITYEDYFLYKQKCFDSVNEFLTGPAYQFIMNDVAGNAELEAFVEEKITSLREVYSELMEGRQKVRSQLEGAVCIIGTTATSTTDFGVIQYEDSYPNTGCHYALANMILSQDFVDDSPAWVQFVLAFILVFAYSLCTIKTKGTSKQIVAGAILIAASGLLNFIFFVVSRKFLGFIVPEAALLMDFVITTVFGFMTANKERRFITNAFSQCLSKTVVNEIVANPASFKLGGQKLQMTAIFTDIQKFSSFSELLTASQLVALLNYYLTAMSDIIMDQRGTVDKYEGDAIIALVGAPVPMEDHGKRAVMAAIQMKAAEKIMNEAILKIASMPKNEKMDQELYDSFKIMVQNKKQIFTRIGINSGEMIAGYMGSENKKNYTMMGNNVNLASRLEGVNKQYSTGGILISQATRELLDDEFIVRSLDRVRVVNVNTPIRLYEPLAYGKLENEALVSYVQKWEKAMEMFEAARIDEPSSYKNALDAFRELAEEKPEDKVALYYISLVEKFFIKGKYPVEADGFGVEYNPEDRVFRLLQK